MKRWLAALSLIVIALEPACVHRVADAGPHVWQLRGAVVAVTDTRLQVRHKTGQIVELQIDDRTTFVRNKQVESWQSLTPATRVMVDVENQQGLYRARLVQMFGGGRK